MTQVNAIPEDISTLLRQWLPAGFEVVASLARTDLPVPQQDREQVCNAATQRQAEFIAGRWCAYRALERLGVPQQRLIAGALGAPVWPQGVTGSITHDEAVCVAVAGRNDGVRGQVMTVGIDLCAASRREQVLGVSRMVLSRQELVVLQAQADPTAYAHANFCAKEAVVKAVSTTVNKFLDLRHMAIAFDGATFSAQLEGHALCVRGWYGDVHGHALAAVVAVWPAPPLEK